MRLDIFLLLLPGLSLAQGLLCSSSLCLPDNYTKMDLPSSVGPVVINTTIFLIDIFKVHPETFTLDLSLYIKFEWEDNRIQLETDGTVEVGGDFISELWRPNLYIWNSNGEQPYRGKLTMDSLRVIRSRGRTVIVYSTEIHLGVVWPMDFSRFPFDVNECEFRLSSYTYQDADKLVFSTVGSLPADTHLDVKKVRNYEIGLRYLTGAEVLGPSWDEQDKNSSSAGLKILLSTRPDKYVLVYHLPAAIFSLTSWFSFLLPPTAYPARTGLLVTVFLCQIGTFNAVIKHTPNANGGNSVTLKKKTF